MKKRILLLFCLCLPLLLTSCAVPEVVEAFVSDASPSVSAPDLRLLTPPAYEEETFQASAVSEKASDALRVDLWLDASQVMGGVNPAEESMYPHMSRKFREGGFHYRYGSEVGLYESVLRCMLSAAEGSRVRLLRCGNERLTDEFLYQTGVADRAADTDSLRSLRRDMLTFAIDPMPTVFAGLSAEDMTDSFYSLGSPMLTALSSVNQAALENPASADRMLSALEEQRTRILSGETDGLVAEGDEDYPLLYALENLDLTRLSVITCDPATIRRLSTVGTDGTPLHLVDELLTRRGVFDEGLCVGLYALTLDYMGEIASFGPADFSEPIVWGRLAYDTRTHKSTGVLPMPRTLLVFVIGQPEQVSEYTRVLDAQMGLSEALKELRGPQNGELTYVADGETVTQEPFSFESRYTSVARPVLSCQTQRSPDIELASEAGAVSTQDGLTTVTLSPDSEGRLSGDTLTLKVPAPVLSGGAQADLSRLSNAELSVQTALLLSDILPSTEEAPVDAETQVIALRDKQYIFRQTDDPFASDADSCPFDLSSVSLSSDGTSLLFTMSADGEKLRAGYYRLLVSADLSGEQIVWETAPWISALDVTLTNEQIAQWESFTQLITQYDRKSALIPKQFQHAWGSLNESGYHGSSIPDLPSVMLVPWLKDLAGQLQTAANVESLPLLRYTFDIFVTGDGTLAVAK